jgi:hypothetical protein
MQSETSQNICRYEHLISHSTHHICHFSNQIHTGNSNIFLPEHLKYIFTHVNVNYVYIGVLDWKNISEKKQQIELLLL